MARSEDIKSIIDLVRPVFHGLYRAAETKLRARDISVPQRGMLQNLLEKGAQTVPSLARNLLVQRQFALRLANELETMRLIERKPNPAHKRSDRFQLSSAGATLIAEVLSEEAAVSAWALAGVSDDDLRATAHVLAALRSRFGAGGSDAAP